MRIDLLMVPRNGRAEVRDRYLNEERATLLDEIRFKQERIRMLEHELVIEQWLARAALFFVLCFAIYFLTH